MHRRRLLTKKRMATAGNSSPCVLFTIILCLFLGGVVIGTVGCGGSKSGTKDTTTKDTVTDTNTNQDAGADTSTNDVSHTDTASEMTTTDMISDTTADTQTDTGISKPTWQERSMSIVIEANTRITTHGTACGSRCGATKYSQSQPDWTSSCMSIAATTRSVNPKSPDAGVGMKTV